MREGFRKFANATSNAAGSPSAFLLAFVVVLVWGSTGPIFRFADTWQLVINTGTTIVTFLMVFLIQNTQNRDSQAIHAKLDELLIGVSAADNRMVRAEDLSEDELRELKAHFEKLAESGEVVAEELEEEAEQKEQAKKNSRRGPAAASKAKQPAPRATSNGRRASR